MTVKIHKSVSHAVSLCPIWPTQASEKIGKMLSEIQQGNALMRVISDKGQDAAIKGGFAAETWHAESFNLDAILKDKNIRAFTDTFKGTPLTRNDAAHDIVVMNRNQKIFGAQLKYYKTPEATQKEFRSLKDGIHKYKDNDIFLGPSDQLEGIKISANNEITTNQLKRPHVADAAKTVRDGAADSLAADGVKSTQLTKREAEQVGQGTAAGKQLHEKMQAGYLDKATVQQTLRAAGSAAIITTVIAGSINTFQYLQQVKDGKLSTEEATRFILQETAIAAGDSALKAGAATATVSMVSRSLPQLFAGSVFKRSFANGGVAGLAVCAVDMVQCLVLYAAGKMTFEELEIRTGKNLFQTGAGVAGASLGAAVGAVGGPVGVLIGSLIGGVISTLAMDIAIDNHIEKSFRLNLDNTLQLISSGKVMSEAVGYLAYAQNYYADFKEGLAASEQHFENQVAVMGQQSRSLRNKINKI
ncbi:hypothetical protein [Pantoea piersonii]|uniref:hypothetical protein n=1 Tax=Pantoea piersonii TaxID=2364647 RepID=UPI0028AFDBDA|nr:hypothetical protein [Pantoea piersonii]